MNFLNFQTPIHKKISDSKLSDFFTTDLLPWTNDWAKNINMTPRPTWLNDPDTR